MAHGRDIDRILCQLAAQDQVTDLDSGRRWARLCRMGDEAQRARQRTRQHTWALAASLGLLLIGVAIWQDVGTEDFTLVPAGRNPAGHEVFRGRHRPYSISLGSDSLGTEGSRRVGEEILATTEAGGGRLLYVRGTTINGITDLVAFAEVRTSRGPQIVSANVDIPLNDKVTAKSADIVSRFMLTRFAETRRAIREGRARNIGSVDVVVAGRVFRCDRWEFSYPEFGTVIYWSSAPLP